MDLNLDKWVESAKNGKLFTENELIKLCSLVSKIFLEESNVQHVSAPVKICGDIHGQFFDLEELFCIGGQIPDTNYIFMGDYVDRGYFSLKTLVRLLTLKARYPDKIVLLRGNHESRKISQVYGFYDECLKTYGSNIAWKYCCEVFDLMNVAAIIENQIFCVHGGLSPTLDTIDQIRLLDRYKEIPCNGPLSDIVWSDPDDVYDWEVSPRGAGWLFGPLHTKKFMKINDLTLICRAHQLVDEGYRYMFDKSLVTVWSAPNYCYRCGNVAAIFEVDSIENHNIKIFQAVPDDKREIPKEITTPYFL